MTDPMILLPMAARQFLKSEAEHIRGSQQTQKQKDEAIARLVTLVRQQYPQAFRTDEHGG